MSPDQKTMPSIFFLVLLSLLGVAVPYGAGSANGTRFPLILISCDGFRHDYFDRYPNETRFLRQLIPKGAYVEAMQPTFATETFPAHWTIVTGLFQESHGIISNKMYDPDFRANFTKRTWEERWWNASLPIWITAKKQGLKTGTFFWPGSEVQFNGSRPDFWFQYNEYTSYVERAMTVAKWITEEGVQLATMYFPEPDQSGHKFGPKSTEVQQALARVDGAIRVLFERLEAKNFRDKVNVLIVSDHGMMEKRDNQVIYLNNETLALVDRVFDSGALLTMNAKAGRKAELLRRLKMDVRSLNLSIDVYAKEDLPSRFHYGRNRRVPEVVVLPREGYLVYAGRPSLKESTRIGHHGFDNRFADMSVPMIGVGPSFRKNITLRATATARSKVRQVDIYGLMCKLLRITPQPNNGSIASLPHLIGWEQFSLSEIFKAIKILGSH